MSTLMWAYLGPSRLHPFKKIKLCILVSGGIRAHRACVDL